MTTLQLGRGSAGVDDPKEWRMRANCRSTDPEYMQPEVATPQQVADAKTVCIGCRVFAECAADALSQRMQGPRDLGAYGIWAGQWHGSPPRDPSGPPAE